MTFTIRCPQYREKKERKKTSSTPTLIIINLLGQSNIVKFNYTHIHFTAFVFYYFVTPYKHINEFRNNLLLLLRNMLLLFYKVFRLSNYKFKTRKTQNKSLLSFKAQKQHPYMNNHLLLFLTILTETNGLTVCLLFVILTCFYCYLCLTDSMNMIVLFEKNQSI